MVLVLSTPRLEEIIRPAAVIREDGDCHVHLSDDYLRLRTISEAVTVQLDYSVPIPPDQTPLSETGTCTLTLDSLVDFPFRAVGATVSITTPFEGSDSAIILRSDGVTYRSYPVEPIRSVKTLTADTVAAFTLRHGDFARAVQAAELISTDLQITCHPDSARVEFSTKSESDPPALRYPLPSDAIKSISGSPTSLNVAVDPLHEMTSLIPRNKPVTIELAQNYLVYEVAYPVPDATLRLSLAKRKQGLGI